MSLFSRVVYSNSIPDALVSFISSSSSSDVLPTSSVTIYQSTLCGRVKIVYFLTLPRKKEKVYI